jgi:hypothetical protein
MKEFSYYSAPITNLVPKQTVDLKTVAEYIRTDTRLKEVTEELRAIEDEAEKKKYKAKRLPYVTFSGVFDKRADTSLISHSGLLCIDLDKIGSNGEAKQIQKNIREHCEPGLMFVSPTGNGLKAVFAVDINEGAHAEYFEALNVFLTTTAKVPKEALDIGAKAISQACFLCSDSDSYYCSTPTLLNRDFISRYQSSDIEVDEVVVTDESQYEAARKWTDSKESFREGNRNHYVTTLVDCCNRYGVNEDYVLTHTREYAQKDFPAKDIEGIVRSRYKHKEHHAVATTLTVTNEAPATSSTPEKKKVSYIRVGTSFYKVIKVRNRYGIEETHLKAWNKDTLLQDYKKKVIQVVPKYDDFCLVPDNLNYTPIIDNCYNLYAPFAHTPAPGQWIWTERLLRHVFGEQYDLGLRYMQILYLHPDRSTIILVLVSLQRGTGKTTFLNWIDQIFGANVALISSSDFLGSFNKHYATSNIICIEETMFEKSLTIEKLKALTTQKSVIVNEKNVSHYRVPFYAKVILTSNYESRFAKIDKEEIRFLVRKLGTPKFVNHSIEKDLLAEIPAFLHYLQSLPPVDWKVSRSGFTSSELKNGELWKVVEESKTGLYKDLKIEITDFFENSNINMFYASPKDLKEKFFNYDHQISLNYIRRVLREEFELSPTEEVMRYLPFENKAAITKTGRPYCFNRLDFTTTPGTDEVPY